MTENTLQRPAVFIDRDGTLIEEVDFLSHVRDMKPFDYTAEALRLLKQQNYLLIVVTNQSGIGRGHFDESAVHAIHGAFQKSLSAAIDAFYFCPHLPEDMCDCRKPGTGMIEQALRDFPIDIPNSWIIGDKKIDIETGFNAGLGTALVMTGYGASEVGDLDRMPDIVAVNLIEAAREICSRDAESV